LLRLGVSAILLAWIAWRTDWRHVSQAFAHLQLHWWLGAVALLLVAQVVSARRWQLLARPFRFDCSLGKLTGFYYIGMYFNLLLPTSVGGDVVRVYYLNAGSGRRLAALATVLLDRLSGLVVLVALACVAVVLSPTELPAWIPLSMWGILAGGALATLAMPFLLTRGKHGPERAQQLRNMLVLLRSPRLLVATTLLSLLVQLASALQVWMVGQAIHVPVPLAYYCIMVPMVSLLTLLPVSVNGMGVREGATALFLAPLGIGEGTALSLALLWFAVYASASLVGGLVYLFGHFPKPVSPADAPAEVLCDGPVDCHSDQGRAGQLRQAA
jgi:uncharacterized membrane protein YbhN (UPF0104 family)